MQTAKSPMASVTASVPRRWLGIGMLAVLGGMLLYIAFATPPQLMWQGFLVALGLAALWLAEKMRRATELTIHLTEDGLFDSTGACIAEIGAIKRVERGTFAMKPSNGFMLRLDTPGHRAWNPGIWWRMGKRVGIGGVMPGAQTKIMADMLDAMVADRQAR